MCGRGHVTIDYLGKEFFLQKTGVPTLLYFFRMRLLSNANVNVTKNLMIKTGSLGSKKKVFIFDLTFFNILEI